MNTAAPDLKRFQRTSSNGEVLLRAYVRTDPGLARRVARVVDGKPTWVFERARRVVFTGGAQGEHSIDLSVSSEARIQAHWEGYCEMNHIQVIPSVGQRVLFPSGSAQGGWRTGRVSKVGVRRVVVEYAFNYGRRSTKTVPIHCCHWG